MTDPASTTNSWRRALAEVFGLDLRSLALFRICLGLILVQDAAKRLPWLKEHYSDAGVLPRSEVFAGPFLVPHLLSGDAWFQGMLLGVALLFAVFVVVGYRTRLALLVSWFLLTSLQIRNPFILQGGDLLLRLLVFWGMFLPLGALWAFDARGRAPLPNLVVSGGSVGFILQVCLLYWAATLMKTHPIWMQEGSAVWYALNIDHFATTPGRILLGWRWAHAPLTFATLALEGLGPCLLLLPFWRPFWRTFVPLSFLLFHAGLGICLVLGPFPWVCGAMWLALFPAWVWENRLARRIADGVSAWLPHATTKVLRPQPQPAWWVHGLAGGFLLYVVVVNVHSLWGKTVDAYLPSGTFYFGDMFAINQSWAMFAPYPLREDGWYIARAVLADGSEVDLLRGGRPVNWEKPLWVSAEYPCEHWRKYMMNWLVPGLEANRGLYARFACREWNATHPPHQQVRRFDLYYMHERTLPDSVQAPTPWLLCRYYDEPEMAVVPEPKRSHP